MKPKILYKSDLYKFLIVTAMLMTFGFVLSHLPNNGLNGLNPFYMMWILIGFPIGITIRYYSEKEKIAKHEKNKNRKTNWFDAIGSFQTKQPMTTKELVALLDEIDEKYGLFYGGSVKAAFDEDKK